MVQMLGREKEILRILSEDSGKTVTEISEMLEVSAVTIRSDLKTLADKGLVVRTRGGAFPAFHPSILERQKHMVEEKERIAKAAASHVEDGDNIMIVAGTTTPLMVKYLLGKRDIHIVTNSTLIYPQARINPSIRLTVVAGEFRPSAEAILGPEAIQGLTRFHVQKAFLGADGFSLGTGITADFVEVAEIVKMAASRSEQSLLLADSSKYGRAGFAHIMGLDVLDGIITDTGLPSSASKALEEFGLSVELV
ncbi:Glucitol operon repressor [Pontiella sulfatireligans]|uniref:Glucitol operon repressor n=2 Tax=Pontiella sulfatireligans TaxID=2750658 RepID=A0A6C2UX10_9BACT|nr:Glucitol operon repressor [Pontiella sulfatireligans]